MNLRSSESRMKLLHVAVPLLDVLLACLSMILALQIYYDMKAPEQLQQLWYSLPVLAVFTLTGLYLVGLYRTLMRYAGMDTLIQIATGAFIGTVATYLFSLAMYTLSVNIFLMQRPIYLIQWLLMMMLLGASRFSMRVMSQGWHPVLPFGRKHGRRVMIVGAGWAGAQAIREAQAGRYGNVRLVLAVDDDPAKKNTRISRVPVMLGTDRVKHYAEQYAIDEIMIAIATPQQDLAPLVHLCTETGCRVRMYAQEMAGTGRGKVRDVNIADLLGRAENHLDMTEVRAYFTGKRVLVTGGGGSIGSELCRQLMEFVPSQLVLYDISENYIYDLYSELEEKYGAMVRNTVFLRVGSIRDTETLDRVFGEFHPEIVIHAAAHKHVPLMEDSPEQAIKNNVFGTYNVALCSVKHNVKRFVMISTDKAVNPTNIMGCTKRLAEIYVQSLGKAITEGKVEARTHFVTTRFGNVLGSNGSVIPRFREQIERGGPVTVTDPKITRYFMTIPEACQLVMEAATLSTENRICVFDMGEPVKIDSLVRRMIELSGLVPDEDIKIVYTGLRPGEKLYEEVLSNKENTDGTSHDRIRIARVREYEYADAVEAVTKLTELARDVRIPDMVRLMKRIVPEYISNNSRFEEYDRK